MGNKMDFDKLGDGLNYYGEEGMIDPRDMDEAAEVGEPHFYEGVVFLSPRPDNYTPVICEKHRLVQCLLSPTQRVAAENYAEKKSLAIAR